MVYDYGFPDPQYCRSAIAIRQWYFAKMTNARIAGQAPPGPMPNFSWSPKAPAQPQVFYQQAQQQLRQKIQQLSNWWEEQVEKEPIELLLCVESFTDRIRKYPTSWGSPEWLLYQISKDSDLLLSLQIQSLRPIELWGKDYIVIQTTQPGSEVISVARIGCRLRRPGTFLHQEEKHLQWVDLGTEDALCFNLSEVR